MNKKAEYFSFAVMGLAVLASLILIVAQAVGVSAQVPTMTPTVTPTSEPSVTPTTEPTATPTDEPTPTSEPTPTTEPTATPTDEPTPTTEPTATPTTEPTETPTEEPTLTPTPTEENWLTPICHVPAGNPENSNTIYVATAAVTTHLALHPGDIAGPCAGEGKVCRCTYNSDACDDGISHTIDARPFHCCPAGVRTCLDSCPQTVRIIQSPDDPVFRRVVTCTLKGKENAEVLGRCIGSACNPSA